jgi:hypothetical protein
MLKVGDVVKMCDFVKVRTWYNSDIYKIIIIENELCTLYNLSKNEIDDEVIHVHYLELALKEYRKQKLNKITNKI